MRLVNEIRNTQSHRESLRFHSETYEQFLSYVCTSHNTLQPILALPPSAGKHTKSPTQYPLNIGLFFLWSESGQSPGPLRPVLVVVWNDYMMDGQWNDK